MAYLSSVISGYAASGHDKGNYFLGQFTDDPGFWFYPVNWVIHVTPPVLFGVALGVVFWLADSRDKALSGWRGRLVGWLGYQHNSRLGALTVIAGLFGVLFLALVTASTTKQDRYLLPLYPWLNIVAAAGWVWLLQVLAARTARWTGLRLAVPLGVLLLLVNGWLVIAHYPYYFSYYNPLTGGLPVAQKIITVGWGEGLDQAAAYLNQSVNAESATVAAWYGKAFAPYFAGQTQEYFQNKGPVISADYALVYVNQKQRRLPDEGFFRFLEQQPLERQFEIDNVPYVWLYRMPSVDYFFDNQRYDGVASLLGWEYLSPVDSVPPVVRPGDELEIGLWWEYLGKPPEEAFFVWLIGPDNGVWSRTLTVPAPEAGESEGWQLGQIIAERGSLEIPLGTPPGRYRLLMGFYPETVKNPEALLFFEPEDTPVAVMVTYR
jgi:hypothetical protein